MPFADQLAARLRAHPLLVDATLALVAFAVSIGLMLSGGLGTPDPEARPFDALGLVLATLGSLPLLVRRRAPYAALAVTAAATVATYGAGYTADVQIGSLIALYGIGASARDGAAVRRGQIALALVVVIGLCGAAAVLDGPALPELTALIVFWVGSWLAGDRSRLRRAQITELRERAQRAEREAERERRLAAAEERTRIARELHDSAGHAINVILVQAGAARLLRQRDPEGSAAALDTVEQVARTTIGEIDRLVHALREGGPEEPLVAGRGLDALERLAAHHRDGGLPVALGATGDPRPLPGEVDRALYRIVQEALTNAARHGDGPATVALDYAPDALRVTVENPVAADGGDGVRGRDGDRGGDRADGNGADGDGGPAGARGGHGLVGMRERAALLGGELDVERAGSAFRVRARLPL
jgi:signal transduction histidine kinase